MNIVKRVLKIVLGFLGLFLVTFLLLVFRFQNVRFADATWQNAHLARLQSDYLTTESSIDEQSFLAFDENLAIPFNEVRMIASHNSYKKMGTELGKQMIALVEGKQEADLLRYGNHPITDQLNVGIRSFELDVRYRNNQFETTHVPLVDNSTTMLNLSKGFEEINLWSKANPNHMPIVILLELKSDWEILDPFLLTMTLAHVQELAALSETVFQDRLFKPSDLVASYTSIQDRLQTIGWPTLPELKGKVLIVLHASSLAKTYAETDLTSRSLALFSSIYESDKLLPYAAFVIHNHPEVEVIQSLLDLKLIVRTRIDSDLIIDPDIASQALSSGAQILSTDYHPASVNLSPPLAGHLPSAKMMDRNPYFYEEE